MKTHPYLLKGSRMQYVAQWEEYAGGYDPVETFTGLPVTVHSDTVSFFVTGTIWKGTVSEESLVSVDGTKYERENE